MKTSTRNKIKESNFALPEQRKYPIHDVKHARLALAFVSMHGSPSEQATVRAKVHSRYPEIGKEASMKLKSIEDAIEKIAISGGIYSDPDYKKVMERYNGGNPEDPLEFKKFERALKRVEFKYHSKTGF